MRAAGRGALTLARLTSGPGHASSRPGSGGSFELEVAPSSHFTDVTISDCHLGDGTLLRWWEGGHFVTVEPSGYEPGSPACVVTSLDARSTPALTELDHAVFSVTEAPIEGSFVPVAPSRILDARPGSARPGAGRTIGAGHTLVVQVAGLDGVPRVDACAAVLNVTDTGSTAAGYLTLYATGTARPVVSNLNFRPGEVTSNLATTSIGDSGRISVFNSAGATNVAIELEGYDTCAAGDGAAGRYDPVVPVMVLGSAHGAVRLGPDRSRAARVTGPGTGVPRSAEAVVLDLTASDHTTRSWLTVSNLGTPGSDAADLEVTPGATTSNLVTAAVGPGGIVEIHNAAGSAEVTAAIDGYYTGVRGGAGLLYVPITPRRIVDTRSGRDGIPIAARHSETFELSPAVLPSAADALAGNITTITGTGQCAVQAAPAAIAAPKLNCRAHQASASFLLAAMKGRSGLALSNESRHGELEVIVDLFGYFVPAPRSLQPPGRRGRARGRTEAVRKLVLDLHEIYNRGHEIDRALDEVMDEAVRIKAGVVEIIPGKGSGQLKRRVIRYLDRPEVKARYHRMEKDERNFGRIFVHFRWR